MAAAYARAASARHPRGRPVDGGTTTPVPVDRNGRTAVEPAASLRSGRAAWGAGWRAGRASWRQAAEPSAAALLDAVLVEDEESDFELPESDEVEAGTDEDDPLRESVR